MADYPLGLSLTEIDDGFLLRRTSTEVPALEFILSVDELFTLRETIALWTDRILSQRQGVTGLRAVVTHPVAQVRLDADALQQNVLLTVAAPSGEQMTFQMPRQVAHHLVTEIPAVLALMDRATSTKQ
jgi:hypothetical protein